MTTYLFIWAIMAGTSTAYGSASYQIEKWHGQWMNGGAFEDAAACHKAAANLGLSKDKFRCLDQKGVVQ